MNKTVAEAAEFVDALLPRIAATQNDVVICPPFLALSEVVERRRGTAVRVAAQNMHEEDVGRLHRRGLGADAGRARTSTRSILGHSERRQLFGETDEALARKVPAALAAGLEPILCVGETEEARDAGETEAVLERQLQADLAARRAHRPGAGRRRLRADLGDRHRPHRDPRAGPGGDRLHPRRPADARRRGRRGPDPLRRLGQARQRRRAARAARTIDGALVGGASLDPDDFAAIVEAADRVTLPVPSLALVILDGWGLAEPGPGNAISLAETPVFDRLWERFPAHPALRPGPRRRPARRADGQLRGRPPQPRRRGDRQAGPGADRRRGRRRQLLRERGAAGRLRARPQQPARPPAPARPRLRRRRPLRLGAHRGLRSSWPPRRACPTSSSTPSPTAATPCRTAAAATSPSSSAGCARPAASPPSAAATTRWTATPAGSGSSSPTTRSSTPAGLRAASAAEAIEASYERDETDEFVKPTVIGDYDGAAAGRRRDLHQLPPRPRPGDDQGPGRARLRRVPARRRPAPRPDDDDRVPQGLALPGRLPGAAARRRRWPRRSPRPAAASCTSPRPRSTPTSPTSSTAAASRSGRGRSAAWSTRRATCRPTTTSRR